MTESTAPADDATHPTVSASDLITFFDAEILRHADVRGALGAALVMVNAAGDLTVSPCGHFTPSGIVKMLRGAADLFESDAAFKRELAEATKPDDGRIVVTQ